MEAWPFRVCLQGYDTRFLMGLAQGWRKVIFESLSAPQNCRDWCNIIRGQRDRPGNQGQRISGGLLKDPANRSMPIYSRATCPEL
jgi:hypothetical protein